MLPVITIVGRPNVGKSTLFNVLTRSQAALVADMPGVTRDRQYGEGQLEAYRFIVVDTGGLQPMDNTEMTALTDQQVRQAIDEADRIFFMVDAKSGLTPNDELIAEQLRAHREKVMVVVNKIDHEETHLATSEFHQLGLGEPLGIAAVRKRGVKVLIKAALQNLPIAEHEEDTNTGIKVAVIGRPNVGKSTLINRILGEARVVVSEVPGTTRDSIYIPFDRRDQKYTIIDTAGVRRKSKVGDAVEKFSVIKTIQAVSSAHVILLLLNARDNITEQDLRLIGQVVMMGKALVLVINKWDNLDEDAREHMRDEIDRRLSFVEFARRYFISALHGTGVGHLYRAVDEAYHSANKQISTGELTRALHTALDTHQPPLVKGRRIKLRFAHLGGHHPLIIIVHGKQTESLPQSYQRFLINYFRKTFQLVGVPILLRLQKDANPYKNDK